MKKVVVIIAAVALLLLDWAALDDITTGNEVDYLAEYLILFVSLPMFAILGSMFSKKQKDRI